MQPISLAWGSGNLSAHAKGAVRLSRRASRILSRNQLLLKALPTAAGYAGGDCLTQMLGPLWPAEHWPGKHDWSRHDPTKTLLMAGVGAGVGAPASLALYAWMATVAPGAGPLLGAAKFVLDQVVGCVLWQAAYLAISEPYRRTFLAFAGTQRQAWQARQQQQHQHQHQQQHVSGPGGCLPAVRATAVAAC